MRETVLTRPFTDLSRRLRHSLSDACARIFEAPIASREKEPVWRPEERAYVPEPVLVWHRQN